MSTLTEIEAEHMKEVSPRMASYRKNKKAKFLSNEYSDFCIKRIGKRLGRSKKVFGRLIMLEYCDSVDGEI